VTEVVIETVVLAGVVVESVTVEGLKLHAAYSGSALQVNDTVPVIVLGRLRL